MSNEDKHYVVAARFFGPEENLWVRHCNSDKDRENTIGKMKSNGSNVVQLAVMDLRDDGMRKSVESMTATQLLDLGRDMLKDEEAKADAH